MEEVRYAKIMSPITIGNVRVKNRVVRAAHGTQLTHPLGSLPGTHVVNDALIAYHVERAKGGVGLSLLESASVHPSSYGELRGYNDDLIDGLGRIAEAVHEHDMKIFQQLQHHGHHSRPMGGFPPWGISSMPSIDGKPAPVVMTRSMIEEIVGGFGDAAARVVQGGMDGIELHAGHGYLLAQSLSPAVNRRTDEFRVRKELLKATYVTARAKLQVAEEIPAATDPGAAAEAAGRLRDVTAEIRQQLGRQPLPDGLLELRPDGEIRLIFGLEPPGTALVIAVLEGREAARDQYRDAVLLSADVLLETRAGQAPEASAHAYDDLRSLAEEFFPGQTAEVQGGAAALAARNRARTLAEERTRLGLTQTEVAQRMGVPPDQVAAIERAGPGTTDVRTMVSYVEALGGRLTLTADFGGDRVILR